MSQISDPDAKALLAAFDPRSLARKLAEASTEAEVEAVLTHGLLRGCLRMADQVAQGEVFQDLPEEVRLSGAVGLTEVDLSALGVSP